MNKRYVFMRADTILSLYGTALIGKQILTPALGDYPGGWATVTEINPDENAPDIPFMVDNPSWIYAGDGRIGILEYEQCMIDYPW